MEALACQRVGRHGCGHAEVERGGAGGREELAVQVRMVALVRRVVRFGHADGRMDARKVGRGIVTAIVGTVRAAAAAVVERRRGRSGVHGLGLDLGGRRPARHHQVLSGVLLLLVLLLLLVQHGGHGVQLMRPRVVHRRFVVHHVQPVAVAAAASYTAAAAAAAVRSFARVFVVHAIGTAARRTGTVLGRPLGQVHAAAAAAATVAAAAAVTAARQSLVVPFVQRYRRVFLENETNTLQRT